MSNQAPETRSRPLLTNKSPSDPSPSVAPDTHHSEPPQLSSLEFVSKNDGPQLAVSHDLHQVPGGKPRLLYFRYQVWKGHTVLRSVHVPGGNVTKPIAIARATKIQRWIKNGVSPDAILRQLEDWKRRDKRQRSKQLSLL